MFSLLSQRYSEGCCRKDSFTAVANNLKLLTDYTPARSGVGTFSSISSMAASQSEAQ
jgi:hypothetical protein